MLNAQVFKKRHFLMMFFLMVIFFGIYSLSKLSPLEQSIVREQAVNTQANIFITEASAGATTDFSYRYYLYDSSKTVEDFKKALSDDYSPFLITSDANALIKVENGVIYLNVKGKIFSFNNLPAYNYNNSIYTVPVVITAKPY
ncbi:hypothetical protein [Pantoea sp. SOD02]|uniref:hypothetical protein n=1 Tax=Pantoea sp. SOD02 TaxID=2970818 RepID=UPI0012ADC3BA|nr:hypothetical protein [Pantoea sp. SOD02]MRS20224.1 hypothetical protein [Enterobacteriaceae bacterium RIT692]UVC29929.1 hypothetical protein NR302_02835 [Pantoea sp. SOD02]